MIVDIEDALPAVVLDERDEERHHVGMHAQLKVDILLYGLVAHHHLAYFIRLAVTTATAAIRR